MQLIPIQTTRFRRDIKQMMRRRKTVSMLEDIIRKLVNGETLPVKNKDHELAGNWKGCRECHITPDWLLVYHVAGNELKLIRTGSHSDIFG